MSRSIKDYFKQTKTSSAVQKDNNHEPSNKAEDFYQECLKEAPLICKKESCAKLKCSLKDQLNELMIKCNSHEDASKQCSLIIAEKDREIEELRQIIASKVDFSNACKNAVPSASECANECASETASENAASTQSQNSKNSNQNQYDSLRFCAFAKDFNNEQLATLRDVPLTMQKDSKFITILVRMIYDGKFECLKHKSVTGRSGKAGENKTPITPQKMDILTNIFNERIQAATEDNFERVVRKKKLNKLIKDALSNIYKSFEIKEREKQACRQLKFSN